MSKKTPVMLCELRVRGHLASTWSEWFDGLQMRNTEDGDTVLVGALADQATLIGVLARLQALNLRLLTLTVRDGAPASATGEATEAIAAGSTGIE